MSLSLVEPAMPDPRAPKLMRAGGRTSGHDEWLTPPHVIKALGDFDLDPCAPTVRPWDTARVHIAPPENGLLVPWRGRVWMNPPYSKIARWMGRLAEHGDGIALVPARTCSRWFEEIAWDNASAALFLRGRIRFHRVDGTRAPSGIGTPLVLFAFGARNAQALHRCGLPWIFTECAS